MPLAPPSVQRPRRAGWGPRPAVNQRKRYLDHSSGVPSGSVRSRTPSDNKLAEPSGKPEYRNNCSSKESSQGKPALIEPKSVSHRMLTQRVGLLRVPFFAGLFGLSFSRLLRTAVEALKIQGCDRLIVDLRGCLGGSLGMASLVSYLCPDRIPIGYDVTRSRLQRGYTAAELPRVPMPDTKVGPRLGLKPLRVSQTSCLMCLVKAFLPCSCLRPRSCLHKPALVKTYIPQ
jgi:hypothetical protein